MRYGGIVTLRERVKIGRAWINPDDVIWMNGLQYYRGKGIITQFYLGRKGKKEFTRVRLNGDDEMSDLFFSMINRLWVPRENIVVKKRFNAYFNYDLNNIDTDIIGNPEVLNERIVSIDKVDNNNIISIKRGDMFVFSYNNINRDGIPLIWSYPITYKKNYSPYTIKIYPYLIAEYFEESEYFKDGIDSRDIKEVTKY